MFKKDIYCNKELKRIFVKVDEDKKAFLELYIVDHCFFNHLIIMPYSIIIHLIIILTNMRQTNS